MRAILLRLSLALSATLPAGCGGTGAGDEGAVPAPTGAFTTVGSLATGRVGHTATRIEGSDRVLVAGGRGRSGATDAVLDSAELFDPATGQFTPVTGRLSGGRQTGQNGRMNHAAVALPSGRVLIAGGQTDVAGGSEIAYCERFDPTLPGFVDVGGALGDPKAEPLALRYDAAGVTYVMVAGGRTSSDPADPAAPPASLASADVYAFTDDRLSPAPPGVALLTGRFDARTIPLAGTESLVVGGVAQGPPLFLPSPVGFEVFGFDAATGAPYFAASHAGLAQDGNASLVTDRSDADVAPLGGQVAVLGGVDAAGEVLDTIEVYDPATNSWTELPARLRTPRRNHTVTRLANGDVLVIGGQSPTSSALDTSEVVSVAGARTTVVEGPPLARGRRGHTATLLPDGRVLVVGGEDATGVPVEAAEVFAPPGAVVPGAGSGPAIPGGPRAPAVASLDPASGPVGAEVVVKGTGFDPDPGRNVVRFHGILAPVQGVVAGDLRVIVPCGATTGEVTVQVGRDLSTGGATFAITQGP